MAHDEFTNVVHRILNFLDVWRVDVAMFLGSSDTLNSVEERGLVS